MLKKTGLLALIFAGVCVQAAPALGVFPVKPRERIRLEGTVQAAEKFSFDKRPELRQFFGTAVWFPGILQKPVANVRWRFLNAKGREIKPLIWEARSLAVFSAKPEKMIIEAYPPEGAVKIELSAFPAGSVTGKFSEKLADDSTRNINPDFSLGPYNRCGWGGSNAKAFYRGALEPDAAGKPALNIQSSWAWGDPFPVKAGETLQVACAGIGGTDHFGSIGLIWLKNYSKDGKGGVTKRKLVLSGSRVKEAVGNFPVPKGVTWARIGYSNTELQYCRITAK